VGDRPAARHRSLPLPPAASHAANAIVDRRQLRTCDPAVDPRRRRPRHRHTEPICMSCFHQRLSASTQARKPPDARRLLEGGDHRNRLAEISTPRAGPPASSSAKTVLHSQACLTPARRVPPPACQVATTGSSCASAGQRVERPPQGSKGGRSVEDSPSGSRSRPRNGQATPANDPPTHQAQRCTASRSPAAPRYATTAATKQQQFDRSM